MALIEYHRHGSDAVSVTFSERFSGLIGVTSYSGSLADLKRVIALLGKKDDVEVGDPITLELFQPPEEETDDE